MKEIRTVLVAGAGAIGSMVAWQIERSLSGAVSVLASGERLERYRKNGFVVNGEPCPLALTDAASSSNPDLVIIACKYHHLDAVMRDLKNHIGPDTLILSLLNGISSERILGEVFGSERLPYAMIIGTDAGHEGNRTTFSKTGVIFFGDAKNGAPTRTKADPCVQTDPGAQAQGPFSDRVQAIADFFDKTGIAYRIPVNMLNRLWYKFMLNVGLNQVTAILRKPYRLLKTGTNIPEAKQLFEDAMREVIAIGKSEGITLSEAEFPGIYAVIDSLSDDGKTSMCQDIEAGRKTEIELFAGTVLELGGKHGIPVPVNKMLYRLLRAAELYGSAEQ